eukprot:765291-Hanusia_phi.AAC.2
MPRDLKCFGGSRATAAACSAGDLSERGKLASGGLGGVLAPRRSRRREAESGREELLRRVWAPTWVEQEKASSSVARPGKVASAMAASEAAKSSAMAPAKKSSAVAQAKKSSAGGPVRKRSVAVSWLASMSRTLRGWYWSAKRGSARFAGLAVLEEVPAGAQLVLGVAQLVLEEVLGVAQLVLGVVQMLQAGAEGAR